MPGLVSTRHSLYIILFIFTKTLLPFYEGEDQSLERERGLTKLEQRSGQGLESALTEGKTRSLKDGCASRPAVLHGEEGELKFTKWVY